MNRYREIKGFTLVELMVSTTIFMIAVALMYPTFSFMGEQADYVSDKQALHERGQRILDYMTQDLSTAGFVVGSTTGIPYCSTTDVDVIQHTNAEPNDQLSFITSKPLEIKLKPGCITPDSTTACTNTDYYLNICEKNNNKAVKGDISFTVDAPLSCVDGFVPTTNYLHSGKSIIAFERASQIKHIYKVSNHVNDTITIQNTAPYTSLLLDVPANSMVYTVRQYGYEIIEDSNLGALRTLRRIGRKSNCTSDPVSIDEAFGPNGGIDAMQFQFIHNDPVSGTQSTVNTLDEVGDIKDLRAIRVILLVRSERPDRNHTNDNLYDLGGTLNQPLQFNDNYRRVVLSKTVEVKSVVF